MEVNKAAYYGSCLKCKQMFKKDSIEQSFCGDCSDEIWKDIDDGLYNKDVMIGQDFFLKKWLKPR